MQVIDSAGVPVETPRSGTIGGPSFVNQADAAKLGRERIEYGGRISTSDGDRFVRG